MKTTRVDIEFTNDKEGANVFITLIDALPEEIKYVGFKIGKNSGPFNEIKNYWYKKDI